MDKQFEISKIGYERKKVTNHDQRLVAEILTQFMFTRDMKEVLQVWDDIYKQYDLCDDPFTHCPCSSEDYCKSRLEYDKQTMIDRYGHCDGLE